jgi:hypothetical protein
MHSGPVTEGSIKSFQSTEDVAFVQIYERRQGRGFGILRVEGSLPRDCIPFVGQLKHISVTGRPNWTVVVDGQVVALPMAKSGPQEEQPPEDDESRLLEVRKGELVKDIARMNADLSALQRSHDRQRELHAADLERMGKQLLTEQERLAKERERVDKEIDQIAKESEARRKSLGSLVELDTSLSDSLAKRADSMDTDLNKRVNRDVQVDQQLKAKLAAIDKAGEKTVGEQIFAYVKDAAPATEIQKGVGAMMSFLSAKLEAAAKK